MLVTRARQEAPELLDRPDVSLDELDRSLSDLERANRWLGGRSALLPHLLPMIESGSSFLDVGCGGGDTLRALSREARRRSCRVCLVGVDVNPAVVSIARSRCRYHPDIVLVQADARSLPFEAGRFDVVFSSTVLHHLAPADAACALREADRVSRRRLVVVDLVRSDLCLAAVWVVGKLAFGRLSRYDGPVSVRRSYRPNELLSLAESAGLAYCRVNMHGLFRMALVSDKEAP